MNDRVPSSGVPFGIRVTWDQVVPGLEFIPTDIVPSDDSAFDLGSADKAWLTIYADYVNSILSVRDPSAIGNPTLQLVQNATVVGQWYWLDSSEVMSLINNVASGGGIALLPVPAGDGKLTLTSTLATFNAALALAPEDAITASTTQSQGQQPLTKSVNRVSVCANADDVVTLPAAAAGRMCCVRNDGANQLQIFPATDDAINGGATDASVTLAAAASIILFAMDDVDWYTFAGA